MRWPRDLVENCILSEGRQPGVEGMSKRYRIGRAQPHAKKP